MQRATRPSRPDRGSRVALALLLVSIAALTARAEPAPAPDKAHPAAPEPVAQVKLHDTVVLELSHSDGPRTAADRAHSGSEALVRAFKEGSVETRLERHPGSIVVYAGKTALFELFPADAGDAGLAAFATTSAERAQDVLSAEHRRSELAGTVLSISLVVFFGLVALYVLRRVGEFADRARGWIAENPARLSGIRLHTFDVVGPAAVRGGVSAMLIVGRWLLQFGVAYVWLVFTFSLFAPTRPYTERLTGFVFTPLSQLAGRLAASLPLLFVAFVSGVAAYVLLRFVRLFFASVARGETRLTWLPADLAQATSVLASLGVVVTTLVFAAPVVTGDPEGALARTGGVMLLAIGLALSPLLASGLVGVSVVFGRRLRVGQRIEIATHRGRLRELTLLELRLADESGAEVRVPHLFCLVHPIRVLGDRTRLEVDLALASGADMAEARRVLSTAARTLGDEPAVALIDVDADAGHYRVSVSATAMVNASDLRIALVEALAGADIALGRARTGGSRAR